MIINNYEVLIREKPVKTNIQICVMYRKQVIKALSTEGTVEEIESQLQDETSDLRKKIENMIGEI